MEPDSEPRIVQRENLHLAPLVVVSGPSGVGKTTLVEELLKSTPLPLRRAITATTRSMRPGEVNGTSYHFWNAVDFRKAIDEGRMLEWAFVFDRDFYGTPRSEVDPYRESGTGVILVIDVQGADTVRRAYPNDHLSVFITAPNFDVIEARLRSRKDMHEEQIQKRLETARSELARADKFDRVVVNNELATAVAELQLHICERFST